MNSTLSDCNIFNLEENLFITKNSNNIVLKNGLSEI